MEECARKWEREKKGGGGGCKKEFWKERKTLLLWQWLLNEASSPSHSLLTSQTLLSVPSLCKRPHKQPTDPSAHTDKRKQDPLSCCCLTSVFSAVCCYVESVRAWKTSLKTNSFLLTCSPSSAPVHCCALIMLNNAVFAFSAFSISTEQVAFKRGSGSVRDQKLVKHKMRVGKTTENKHWLSWKLLGWAGWWTKNGHHV